MTANNRATKSLYYLQILLVIVGINVSLYLLAQHTRLKSGIQGKASFCSLGRLADCDVVNSSQYSDIFGIPLAAIGAIFFFALLLCSVAAPPRSPSFRRGQQILAWLCLAGLSVDFVLVLIQLLVIKSLCLMCLLTYVSSLGALACAIGMEGSRKGVFRRFQAILTERKAPLPTGPAVGLGLLALVSFAAAVYLIPSAIRLNSDTYNMVDQALTKFYGQWSERKSETIDWKEGDGTAGNPDSAVQIVEFSDFQCPFCRRAAFTLHNALAPLKDRVFVVFKHFPLDSSCNPALSYQMHPNACSLARLAFCADRKGKFWEFHDHVFLKMSGPETEGDFRGISQSLQSAGLFSSAEIEVCLEDENSLRNVEEDIEIGRKLGVRGTPSVFINGKLVTIPLTVETIRKLVEMEALNQSSASASIR